MTTRAERRALDHGLDRAVSLDRILTRARDLDQALDRGLRRTRNLARTLSHAPEFELTLSLDFARPRALARARTRSRARDLAHDLARARTLTRALAQVRGRDLDRALTHARDLAHELALACAYADDMVSGSDYARALDFARARAHNFDLSYDLGRAEKAIWEFIGAGEEALIQMQVGRAGTGKADDLARSAVRVARLASALLPRQDRTRYAEEYRSELADLAAAGHRRWKQLHYATRLLATAGALRIALAWAHRRRREVV